MRNVKLLSLCSRQRRNTERSSAGKRWKIEASGIILDWWCVGLRTKEGRTQSWHNTSRNTDKSEQKRSPRRCHVTVICALLLFSSLPPPTHLAVARRNAHVRPKQRYFEINKEYGRRSEIDERTFMFRSVYVHVCTKSVKGKLRVYSSKGARYTRLD